MKRQTLFLLSVCANLFLAGMVLHLAQTRLANTAPSGLPQIITQRVVRVFMETNTANPSVVEVNAPFHWSQLESTDYRIYLENLRAIGCPELTIFDIITADVNDLFNGRAKELMDGVTGRFWELVLKPRHDAEQILDAKRMELEALTQERNEVLASLFGEKNPFRELVDVEHQAEESANVKRTLNFLSEEKAARVIEIQDRYKATRAMLGQSNTNLSANESLSKFAELDAQTKQALQAALTPEEYQEYRFRTGPFTSLRNQLANFDGTESEFHELAVAKLNLQGDQELRQQWSSERYAAYQRALDNDYGQTLRITDRFDLPDETAVQIYQMQKAAQSQAKQIGADDSRAADQQQALLQAIQAETEQSISAMLGPTQFQTYKKYGGTWMEKLVTPAQ